MTESGEVDMYPPFSPSAARGAREVMALTTARVAATLASYEVNVRPAEIEAWEAGTDRPDETQLIGLAKALVCPVARLMGPPPDTLLGYRVRSGLSRQDLGKRVGMSETRYAQIERANRWRGDERRTAALVRELGLDMRGLAEVSGAADELENLLVEAVGGRWKPQVSAITPLLGIRRRKLAEALEALSVEHATLPPDPAVVEGAPPRPAFQPVVDRFWELLGNPAADPFAAGIWRQGRFG